MYSLYYYSISGDLKLEETINHLDTFSNQQRIYVRIRYDSDLFTEVRSSLAPSCPDSCLLLIVYLGMMVFDSPGDKYTLSNLRHAIVPFKLLFPKLSRQKVHRFWSLTKWWVALVSQRLALHARGARSR